MDELINDFLAETRDMMQALSGAVVAWEADPADRTRLDEIFRFVHTVKGNCGFFDLPRLQQLSHAAEDALAAVRGGRRAADAALVSAVLRVIDRIGEHVHALETGEALRDEDDAPLIAALRGEAPSPSPVPESGPETTAADDGERRKSVRSIRLSVELLDRMMSGVSDAVLARNELSRRLRALPPDVAVEAAFERISICIAEIRDAITRTRMQRVDSLFAGLPRMVRDLCAELGKQVRLEVDAGDVELDREMIEMIRDPLGHIVRNAIDHGIETPEARVAAGKPKSGRLKVSARQAGNQILIEVADDGRGIDGEALVRKAVAAGILSVDRADLLSAAERTELVFAAGLSTAGQVTAISGRGVGMDVVRANVERIGGLVDLESREGDGVRLRIRVPLTLTIIPALTVSTAGQIFAIPRSAIDEILRASSNAVQLDRVGEANVATVRGRRMPLVGLAHLLGVDNASPEAERKIILLRPAGGDVYALCVDAVHDHEELVVKPAAPAVMSAGIYAGTTLNDDGRPILVLDPSGMAKRAQLSFEAPEQAARHSADEEGESAALESTLLLFRGLDGGVRAVPVALVERIEDVPADAIRFSAGKLRVVLGERILPLAGCRAAPSEGVLRILRLTDGAAELAYGFAEVMDIRSLVVEARPAPAPGEVGAVALIDGNQVELIDPYWLFAAHADAVREEAEPPICAIPLGDPWMENMLKPLIESLGYRVVVTSEPVEADIRIASEGETLQIDGDAGGEAIHRYDRAGLLTALSRGARRKSRG